MNNVSQSSNLKTQNHNSNIKSKDIKIRAYNFSLHIISFINDLPSKRGFWSIEDQLIRSATSIGANMVEAKSSSSKRDFIKFYEIALKSANETRYWICLLRDSYSELNPKCEILLNEVIEIGIGSSVLTLKGKRKF